MVVYASGGLSHFSAGYPWNHYNGPCTLGSICQDFDQNIVEWMQNGNGHELAKLSNQDLIQKGEIELRQWITLMGMVGPCKPGLLTYRAILPRNPGDGSWLLGSADGLSRENLRANPSTVVVVSTFANH